MSKKKIEKPLKMSLEAVDSFFAIFGFKRIATTKDNVIRPKAFERDSNP